MPSHFDFLPLTSATRETLDSFLTYISGPHDWRASCPIEECVSPDLIKRGTPLLSALSAELGGHPFTLLGVVRLPVVLEDLVVCNLERPQVLICAQVEDTGYEPELVFGERRVVFEEGIAVYCEAGWPVRLSGKVKMVCVQ